MAAWTALYSGSNSVSSSELSLTLNSTAGVPAAKTDKGTITLVCDVSAMLAGDQFEIKLYDKARSADTQRLVDHWVLTGAQAYPLFVTPPFMLGEGWDFTIKKITGTDRTITSEIRAYS
jgi:hypothetical protein